jgi:hypothetical protein
MSFLSKVSSGVRQSLALWQNPQTRAQLLGGAALLSALGSAVAAYAFLREPMQVRLDRLTIRLPNAKGHLPPQGLRVLHISDTHFRGADWREQPKINSIHKACANLEYDLLVHTGDFLHEDSGLPNLLALLDKLPAPRLASFAVFGNHDYCVYSHDQVLARAWRNFQSLRQMHAPTPVAISVESQLTPARDQHGHDEAGRNGANGYANGKGNNGARSTPLTHARTLYEFGHYFANSPLDLKRISQNDINALEAALTTRGFQPLHNCGIRLTSAEAGVDLYIAGVDDVIEGTPELQRVLADIPPDAPTILLSHNPDILAEPGIEQADLVLAGHTHGGQIVLPLLGAAHTQSAHLRRREVAGYLRRGKTQVYITRGVGEGIPLRFGAAPQVTLITLLSE